MEQIEVRLTRTQGEAQALDEVADDLWGRLGSFLGFYLGAGSAALEAVLEAPCAVAQPAEEEPQKGEAVLTFEVEGAEAAAAAWIGLAAGLFQLDEVAGGAGWWITSPREDVRAALEARGGALGEDHPLRVMLAPAATFAEHLARLLEAADPEEPQVLSAAWYLGNMAAPPAALVEALMLRCEAAPAGFFKTARSSLERIASRVDLRSLALGRIEGDDPVGFALAVTALAARPDRGGLASDEWLESMERGLTLGEPASDVCADLMGRERCVDPAQLRRITAALLGALGGHPSEETLHNALLSLINLYLHQEAIPPGFLDVLEDQTSAPAPIGGLAAWAVAVFRERPVEGGAP